MELKDSIADATPPANPTSESIQWNWKILIEYDMIRESLNFRIHSMELKVTWEQGLCNLKLPESIQWNWKKQTPLHSPFKPPLPNPFNGIERIALTIIGPKIKPPTPESIQWNWKLIEWIEKTHNVKVENPFNGIESELFPRLSDHSENAESIQWNWKHYSNTLIFLGSLFW